MEIAIESTKQQKEKIKEIRIDQCDKYDKQEHGTKHYLVIEPKRKKPYIVYTDNPLEEVAKLRPDEIYWYPMDVDGETVSLYINTFLAEGYEIDYKRAQDPEGCKEGEYMISGSLYFKIRNT